MIHFKKKLNQLKDSILSSRLRTTLLLLVIIFLFNLNYEIFVVKGQQVQVRGEGIVGFLARWIVNPVVEVLGMGRPGYIPKWSAAVPMTVITFDNQIIYTGDSATLSWSSSNTSSCTGTNFDTGGATSGSVVVNPNSTTIYTIDCNGAEASATLTVKKRPTYIED